MSDKKETASWNGKAYLEAREVCKAFGIEFSDLYKEKNRTWNEADARAVISWLLTTKYELKEAEIGKLLNRHRTSIIEANKRFLRYFETDKEFREKCLSLKIIPVENKYTAQETEKSNVQ